MWVDSIPQRYIYEKKNSTLPTVKIESVLLISVIDAKENRYVAVVDVPKDFLKAYLPDDTYMKLEGVMADKMVEINPEKYGLYVYKNKDGKTILLVKLNRALYGSIKGSLQFWL